MKPQKFTKILWRVAVPIAFGLTWTTAAALQVPGPLVETGWLAEHQAEVVLLDVREDVASYLGTPPGPGQTPDIGKLTGHVPGAISVPWKRVVVKGAEQGAPLKAMLPPPEAFAALMRDSGVNNDSALIIAGRGATAKDQAYATRLYFTLKYFGHDNVALLNGGTAQWAQEGRPLAYNQVTPSKGEFAVTQTREDLLVDTKDVEAAVQAGDLQLLDCRTEDRYLGLSYKRDAVSPEHKGHIAGAKTLPFILLGDNAGPAKLYSTQEIRDVAALKGVDLDAPTILYCDTGTTASLGWFVLHEVLGNEDTRLYDGSMHAWSRLDPAHAVAALGEARKDEARDEASRTESETGHQAALMGPPRSLQTLVDERRDALRRRRNAYFDAASGRHLFQPAWLTAREEMLDGYQDSRRAAHRQYRDSTKLYRDAMRDAYAPWSRPRHEWAEIRHFVSQMEQLDRQEHYDALRLTRAYAPW